MNSIADHYDRLYYSDMVPNPNEFQETKNVLKSQHMRLNLNLTPRRPYNAALVHLFCRMHSSQRLLIHLISYSNNIFLLRLFFSSILLCVTSNIYGPSNKYFWISQFISRFYSVSGKKLKYMTFYRLWDVIRLCLQLCWDYNQENMRQFERITELHYEKLDQKIKLEQAMIELKDKTVPSYSIFHEQRNDGVKVQGMVMSSVQYLGSETDDVLKGIRATFDAFQQNRLEKYRFSIRIRDCTIPSCRVLSDWLKRAWTFSFHLNTRLTILGSVINKNRYQWQQRSDVIQKVYDDLLLEAIHEAQRQEVKRLSLIFCNEKLLLETTSTITRDDLALLNVKTYQHVPTYFLEGKYDKNSTKAILLRNVSDEQQRHAIIHDLPLHDLLLIGHKLHAELKSNMIPIEEFHEIQNWFRLVDVTLDKLNEKLDHWCNDYDHGQLTLGSHDFNTEIKFTDLLRIARPVK